MNMDLSKILDNFQLGATFPYRDNIRFGKYPIDNHLYSVLVVVDNNEPISIAVHVDDGEFAFYTKDESNPLVEDFLNRDDWKQFWCLV